MESLQHRTVWAEIVLDKVRDYIVWLDGTTEALFRTLGNDQGPPI
jgi:hypothetical protein